MADVHREYRQADNFLRRWGAVFILLLFFIGSWGGQYATQLQVEKQQSEQHGQEFSMVEFWPQFWSSTLENWQSEWLQLLTQALLLGGFANYIFRKQDEDHYKTHLMLEDIKKMIDKNK